MKLTKEQLQAKCRRGFHTPDWSRARTVGERTLRNGRTAVESLVPCKGCGCERSYETIKDDPHGGTAAFFAA